jgi:hypothetical protein
MLYWYNNKELNTSCGTCDIVFLAKFYHLR